MVRLGNTIVRRFRAWTLQYDGTQKSVPEGTQIAARALAKVDELQIRRLVHFHRAATTITAIIDNSGSCKEGRVIFSFSQLLRRGRWKIKISGTKEDGEQGNSYNNPVS